MVESKESDTNIFDWEEAVDTVKKCNIGKEFWYLLDKSSEYNEMFLSGSNYIFEVLLDDIKAGDFRTS